MAYYWCSLTFDKVGTLLERKQHCLWRNRAGVYPEMPI